MRATSNPYVAQSAPWRAGGTAEGEATPEAETTRAAALTRSTAALAVTVRSFGRATDRDRLVDLDQEAESSPTIPRVLWNLQKNSRIPDCGNVTVTEPLAPGWTSVSTL